MTSSTEAIRAIIQDELLQVLATGLVLLSLVGVQGVVDNYALAFVRAANDTTSPDMMSAAFANLNTLGNGAATTLNRMSTASIDLGGQASRGVFCNFLGVGFTLVNCAQLNAFRGSLTLSGFAVSAALADVYAQQFLLSLARNTAFTFIIPLGLFFRCFKFSRQAGGALIAIGFGFYTVFPLVAVASEKALHGNPPYPNVISPMPPVGECDPLNNDVQNARNKFLGFSDQLTDFGRAENIAYFILVRVVFESILNLIITLGFIRAFAHLIGSDIDVSALARIS